MALGGAFDDVLVAAKAGAAWAFRRLHEDLAGPVTGYLRLKGAEEPDDVASETFLGVFRNLASFEGDEARFRSWVFTIAHRRLLDERRRRSRRPDVSASADDVDEPSVASHENDVLDRVGAATARRLLDELSDDQRDVVLLRVVAGLSIEETARVVGKRPGAVKQLQRRGLLKLREALARRGVTP